MRSSEHARDRKANRLHHPERYESFAANYVGITNNVRDRLEWHNHGPSGHTVSLRPWSPVVSMEFPSEQDAVRFEKYLKSGSGRAFAKRHFASK